LYAGARMLELLSQSPCTAQQLFAGLPDSISTPELKLNFAQPHLAQALLARLQAHTTLQAERCIQVDGLRAEYAKGWGLIRTSNTSASLTLRFEANDQATLQAIQADFRHALRQAGWKTALPF